MRACMYCIHIFQVRIYTSSSLRAVYRTYSMRACGVQGSIRRESRRRPEGRQRLGGLLARSTRPYPRLPYAKCMIRQLA